MLYLALALLVLGIVFLWLARRRQGQLGLPAGKIIYADTRRWMPVEGALYDPELGLAGRPDYLVAKGDRIVPVEVKSSQVSAGPYDSHIYQLAAYCRLVERIYKKRPPYGIIQYSNRTYRVDYTPRLEAALVNLISEIRALERRRDVARSHDSPARCSGCGYRNICDHRLL